MRLSWTNLKSFKTCQLQHHLRYLDGIKLPGDARGYFVGSVVHDLAKAFADGGYEDAVLTEQLPVIFAQLKASRIPDMTVTEEAAFYLKAADAAAKMAKLYRDLHFQEHHAILESWFRHPLGDDILVGAIDVYDPVAQCIYDLKISKDAIGDKGQLLTYVMAGQQHKWDARKAAFLYPLRKQSVAVMAIEPAEVEAQREEYLAHGRLFATGYDPVPTTGHHCNWCEFNRTDHCPVTRRHNPYQAAHPESRVASFGVDVSTEAPAFRSVPEGLETASPPESGSALDLITFD